MKIAVLDVGVSGLSVARLLREKGHSVVVYEKRPTIGGLASRVTQGDLYDYHGEHPCKFMREPRIWASLDRLFLKKYELAA